jgi:oxidase EvaA
MKNLNNIANWLTTIRDSSNFSVKNITLEQAKDWFIKDDKIQHKSGRFFKVVGVKHKFLDGQIVYQPLLEQREIGTLGFIWRDTLKTPELLVQAKIEPGNVGIVQLAPSCQATESNADRVHGGDISPYSDIFGKHEVDIISSSLQSEQGTRFLGKLNRNVLATTKEENIDIASYIHRWIPVNTVLHLLKVDYLLNTDARSVLVCSNWKKLVGREPFGLDKTKFARGLRTSFNSDGLLATTDEVKQRLFDLREKITPSEMINISELPNYSMEPKGIFSNDKKHFFVKFIEVNTKYREVKKWNQPIVESCGSGQVDLVCGHFDGVLHFLFSPTEELGLLNKIELSPSRITEPGEELIEVKNKNEKVVISCWQSDEGGRFFHDKSLYRIIDIGQIVPKKDEVWLSLKQIKKLLDDGGWLTNEARSALSLLLIWL